MDTIKITVTRSQKWTFAQRLATGRNAPSMIEVSVNPSALSEASRKTILTYHHGEYKDLRQLEFSPEYELTNRRNYGSEDIIVDADAPTDEQIDAAIQEAVARIEARKLAAAEEKAQRAAELAERERAVAERKAQEAAARQLLANELEAGKLAKARVAILSEFLAEIPADAKRCALKKMVADQTEEALSAKRQEIEDAATSWVLKDLDDETEDADE